MRFILGAVLLAITVSEGAAAAHSGPPPRGKIVFNRFFDSNHDWGALFTVDLNGSAVHQLTNPPNHGLDEEPVWSPNGKRVAFQRTESEKTAIYLINADGRDERPLASPGAPDMDSPSWFPGRSRLAVGVHESTREVIAIVNTSGRLLEQVTQVHTPRSTFIDSQPDWSPNGKRLTFVRQTADPSRQGHEALFVINANGTHERRLSPWALRAGHHPVWSPRGTRILFTSNADRADQNLPSNIYSIRPNGKGLRQLTHARTGQLYLSSTFSPNGQWIAFAMQSSTTANAQVFVMHANGTSRHAVTNSSEWSSAPDWTSSTHHRAREGSDRTRAGPRTAHGSSPSAGPSDGARPTDVVPLSTRTRLRAALRLSLSSFEAAQLALVRCLDV
jgi:Tol biopolymer transport system component